MDPLNLGVLASHNGTNLQAIIDACKGKHLKAKCQVVISNNSRSMALQRARDHGIPTWHLSSKTHPNPEDLDNTIESTLDDHEVDLVVLAGYMKLLGPKTVSRYRGRIVNIHPGPLPRFGGQSMFGDRVHKAVLDAGIRTTGVTVHLVDEVYDHGNVLDWTEVEIMADDTIESLRNRVQTVEHSFFVDALKRLNTNGFQLRFKPWPSPECIFDEEEHKNSFEDVLKKFNTDRILTRYSNVVRKASPYSADYVVRFDNMKKTLTEYFQLELKLCQNQHVRQSNPTFPHLDRYFEQVRTFLKSHSHNSKCSEQNGHPSPNEIPPTKGPALSSGSSAVNQNN